MKEINKNTVKTYLQCPECGEYHEFAKDLPKEKVVCLYCDNAFQTDSFQPFAIAYRQKDNRISSF